MTEIIKRIIFMIMSTLMVCIFWDVIAGPSKASIIMVIGCIIGSIIIVIIDLFIES